jgi:hypothetical protein
MIEKIKMIRKKKTMKGQKSDHERFPIPILVLERSERRTKEDYVSNVKTCRSRNKNK